jgi:hypothetical protein
LFVGGALIAVWMQCDVRQTPGLRVTGLVNRGNQRATAPQYRRCHSSPSLRLHVSSSPSTLNQGACFETPARDADSCCEPSCHNTPPLALKLMTHSLFNLTKDVHTRLPREIRELVYQHILTQHCLDEIGRCSPLRLDKFPLPHKTGPESSEARLPDFVDRKIAFRPFADEVIEML